jgi:SAM-dependent methyltransferase
MLQTFPDLMQLANSFGESQALLSANDLDVFTIIGKGHRTSQQVARRSKADPEGIRLLLDALVSLGLLQRARRGYRNTQLGLRYLDGRSPQAITNLLWLLGRHWHDWTKLPDSLRKGRARGRVKRASGAFQHRFALAMHERSHYLAAPTVRAIRLPARPLRFLDLGGGPGSYAIALARRYPLLEGIVLDHNVSIARQLIRKNALGARLTARAGSILIDPLGSAYDAVLISNVVHVLSEQENRRLLRRTHQAMKPGGKVFVVEFFLDATRTNPPKSAVFSVMMYLFTPRGRCYSWGEVEGWLAATGFGRFKRRRITKDIGLLEATKF